jgi:hypothetical protein
MVVAKPANRAVDPSDASQVGQDPTPVEPPLVPGMVHQNRAPGGRAKHAALAHGRADQRVDQGGLSRARRSADDCEQRCIQGAQARDEVVVELLDQRSLRRNGLVDAGDVKRERGMVNLAPEHLDSAQENLAINPDRHKPQPALP